MDKRFSDEAIFTLLPKALFPLWWDDVDDFEVVKNHSNKVYHIHADGRGYYLKITAESEAKGVWRPQKEKFQLSVDFNLHLCTLNVPVVRPVVSKRGHYIEDHTLGEVYKDVRADGERLQVVRRVLRLIYSSDLINSNIIKNGKW